jgi:hypothetical protein
LPQSRHLSNFAYIGHATCCCTIKRRRSQSLASFFLNRLTDIRVEVSVEVEAPTSGVVLKVVAPVEASVPVGQSIAIMRERSGGWGTEVVAAAQAVLAPQANASSPASPASAKIRGTGPLETITGRDVLFFMHEAKSKTKLGLPVGETIPPSDS